MSIMAEARYFISGGVSGVQVTFSHEWMNYERLTRFAPPTKIRGLGKLKGGLSIYEFTSIVKFSKPTGLEGTTPR
jgi:hypothetical protein